MVPSVTNKTVGFIRNTCFLAAAVVFLVSEHIRDERAKREFSINNLKRSYPSECEQRAKPSSWPEFEMVKIQANK